MEPRTSTPPIQMRLIGGFQLRANGQGCTVPLRSQRVLAFLGVHGQVVRRPFVSGSLWPDASEARASASLRSAIWRVHEAGVDIIGSTGIGIGLGDGVGVDIVDLTKLAHRLPELALSELVVFAGTFEGELLPDWYDDWVTEWRERWRQIRLHALEAVAHLLAAAGDHARAIDAGLAAIRAEPLRESAHRTVIEVHIAEGNIVEALRQFRSFRQIIREELGIEPSPALRELVDGLTRR
jgi:DNA-binding SARP family transcriptional activator